MAQTFHATPRFTVKESADGEPWLMIEWTAGELPTIGNSFFGLKLTTGTSLTEAGEIADYLNSRVLAFSHTVFP